MGSPRFVSDLDDDEDEQPPAAPTGPRFVSDLPDDEEPEVPQGQQDPAVQQAPEAPWYDQLLGGAASAADGVLHNYGGELGRTMAHGMNTVGGMVGTGDVMNPDDAELAVDQASRSYPAAHAAGRAGTDALAGLAAPGTIAAQAGMGALTNGAAEYGDSHDAGRAGIAGGLGAAFSGAGAVAGKALDAGSNALGWLAEQGGGMLGKLTGVPGGRMLGKAAGRGLAGAFPKSSASAAPAGAFSSAQKGGSIGSTIAGEFASMFPPEKAASNDKAYATPETYSWAQKAVLSSGHSKLSPEDEQRLGSVLASGDETGLSSLTHQLKQRNPGFARQLERALRAVNGEHE